MNVLGITGRDHDAAAALAVDGRIVSAVAEESFARVPGIGYDQTGGFPNAAVKSCLAIAGLGPGDINELVIVDESEEPGEAESRSRRASARRCIPFDTVPVRALDPAEADALQVALTAPDASSIIVCGANPPVLAAFARQGDTLRPRVDIPGAEGLVEAARGFARVLGVDARDPFAALDRLSLGAEAEFQDEIGKVLQWSGGAPGLAVEPSGLVDTARRVAGEHAESLADSGSLNARVQHMRRTLAASFTLQLAGVLARAAESVGANSQSGPIGVGGGLFDNARFNTELVRLMGQSPSFSAVPGAVGRALGATGAVSGSAGAVLALGPSFSEEDIKRTLDNCRLDYVYEPDWKRLLARVSRMLVQGKIVGWFQGAMAFGPRALGTRSILGDPSNRYARQNMNEYLSQAPLDEPLPLAFASSMANVCLAPGVRLSGVCDVEVRPECRPSLSAALDWRRRARVHPTIDNVAPRFLELLDTHHAGTGTPGLIEVNLARPGEPVACTPRDAVRTVYSSAIDALVIGRFLLMKDYWLLRSGD